MKDIQIYTLFSSSAGNCHYIRIGDTRILFDAGKNAKAILSALCNIGADISEINGIFITHEHTDHTSALRVLQKKNAGIPLHFHPACADKIERSGADVSSAQLISAGEVHTVGDASVKAFSVPHDSGACLGYRIEYEDEGKTVALGIATDIGHLTCEVAEGLCGCSYVIVESNHDPDMLRRGPYPDHLKARIFSPKGHLPNESCARLCAYLCEHGAHHIMLAHLSEENNEPSCALSLTREAVAQHGAYVVCASPSDAVCLFDSEKENRLC